MGRNLRATDAINQEAFLYMPAEPKLVEYAYRVAQDIPDEADVVKFEIMNANFKAKQDTDVSGQEVKAEGSPNEIINTKKDILYFNEFKDNLEHQTTPTNKNNPLTNTYESMMNIFGRFKQETLELGLTPLE
jgi:hypothetical protein